MARTVYVHVGLPKTGTSYLQHTLWSSRDALAQAGVLVPGDTHQFQRFGFWDLLGRRLRGVNQPMVPGSWDALVDAIRSGPGDRVILSDEFLVNARPVHVRRMMRALAPAEMHLVITVRDLGRLIGSMWQQDLSKARTSSWSEFVTAVRDPAQGPATAGIAFWLRCDLQRILSTWEEAVPPERTHVVVVPPPRSPPTQLLDRFAIATDLERAALTAPAHQVNTSLGVTEAELLRRLNESLASRLNERQYLHILRRVVKPVLRNRTGSGSGPGVIRLPAEERDWLADRTTEMIELLKNRPYHVVGDLDDLVPRMDPDPDDPDRVSDAELADAALAALTVAVEQYAGLWWKTQRRRDLTNQAESGTRIASACRALGYKAKVGVLELADRNRLVARATQMYVRRISRER